MKIEIEKSDGVIYLDLNKEEPLFTGILVLSKRGIERCFIGSSCLLSLKGYYIANEDSD